MLKNSSGDSMMSEQFHILTVGGIAFPFVQVGRGHICFQSCSVAGIWCEAAADITGLADFFVPVSCTEVDVDFGTSIFGTLCGMV